MTVTAAEIRAILTLQDQLSGQLSKVQGELQKLGASAGAAGNAAKSAGPSWVSMSTAIAAGTVAANAFMAVAKGVAGVLSSAGSASADFGQSMANIRSLIPDAEFAQFGDQLSKTALRLGKDYPLSAAEAGKSMELLAQKGISAQKIVEGGAESVVKLASATGADLVTATGIAAAAMDTFNVQAADMGKVTNLMTGAMIRGGMSASDFGHAIQSGGAVIALAGGSIEDASIAIAAMAKAGIEGSDAGTSLKTMYMNLQPSTKGATKAMLELGLVTKDGRNAFFDAQGKVKSFEEISRILSNSLEGLTEQQRLQALETMFGSDAIRAAAIAAKFGAGAYGDLGAEIRGVDAGDVAAKRMDSLKASIGQLTGSAETLAITLMGRLGPGMKTVIDTGTELLNGVLDKLDTPEAAAFFESMAQKATQLGNDLYAAGQGASEFGATLNTIPEVGAPLDALFQAVGSTLVAVAAIMRGDAKGAAEALTNAFGSLMTAADEIGKTISRFAEFVASAAQKAGDTGAWGALQNSLGNLQQTVEFAGDRFNELSATMDRVTAASGGAMRPVDALAAIIRGAAQGFEYATVMLDGWIDGALSGINIAANFAVGLSSLGTAMRALATGDIDLLRNSIVNAREAFAAGVTAAEEYRARGLERVGAQAAITAQMVGEGMAQVQASTETSMGAAAAAAEASMADIESSAQTHAAGAVAAVEGQAGAASAAGASLGSNLGAGIVDGIMGWIGRVRAAAAEMVGAAIGSGNVEGEIHSPSERTKETGRMLAAGVAEGIKELSPEVQARMRDLIDAAAEYAPVAGEIKRVEAEIAAVRQRGQTDAIFRAKEMITIDSEALRLKKEMAIAERGMLPIRQALARASREVENLSRGSLGDRQAVIGMDGQRKEIRLQIIDLERQLIGMDSDSKKAQGIQKQIDKLQDQDRLLSLEAERIGLTNEVAATGARIRREALDDQIRGQEDALAPLRDQIALLGAEQSVFQALEAIIKNALDNEIAERERLIAVFRAEAQPIIDRIKVGLAYVDQLEAEGVLTKEQADKLREVGKNLDVATAGTAALGKAAEASAPQIDAATKKADEMAAAGARIAGSYDKAANKVKELGETIGKIDTPFIDQDNPKARLQKRAMGGLVSAGVPYLVGERGPELMVPGSDGTILPSEATASLLDGTSGGSTVRGAGGGGRAVHVHLEGAQIYGFTDFEGAVQRAVSKGLKRGQFGSR